MANDFGRCLVMRVGVRSGQESRCPHFTARNRVEGFGLRRRRVGILTSRVLFLLDGLCCLSAGV